MATAWGQVPVTTFSTAIGPDRFFNWHHVVTSDGRWFIGTNMPRKFLGTASPSYAVLYNWRTGKLQTMARLVSPRSQILGVLAAALFGDYADPWVMPTRAWQVPFCVLETGVIVENGSA